MNYRILKALAMLLVCSVAQLSPGQQIHIIPRPVELTAMDGYYQIPAHCVIGYSDKQLQQSAEYLAGFLNHSPYTVASAKAGSTGEIRMELNATRDTILGNEGYRLVCHKKGVLLTANTSAGIFYAVQSLLQMLPPEVESELAMLKGWKLPLAKITDYPRFGWRGMMLDVSRHFFSAKEVKLFIDEIARYKINVFHWHLTDDEGWRIEIKSYPKLTSVGAWRANREGAWGDRAAVKPGEKSAYGGFYTQEEIKEIVAYAADRHVTIVPEIDVPGHSLAAVAAYPELSCGKDSNTRVNPGVSTSDWYGNGTFKMLVENTLNPSDEKVYEFMKNVLGEIAGLFPGKYIHLGGDECDYRFWKENDSCKALMKRLHTRHVDDLHGYFMHRMQLLVEAYGKKMIGWDEVGENDVCGGVAVMSWRATEYGTEAAKEGHDVVMSPKFFSYLNYCQGDPTVDPPMYAIVRLSKCYAFDPVPAGVDSAKILGGQGNLWTELIPNFHAVEYMAFPRAMALSEVYWSPEKLRNFSDFFTRCQTHFKRLEYAGINYSKSVYDPIVTTTGKQEKMGLLIQTELPGMEIYFTTDGTLPDQSSYLYQGPCDLPEASVTVRVQCYQNGIPVGHLITLNPTELKRRVNKKWY